MDSLTTFSDEELIFLLKEGNQTAFTEIYNRYWQHLYTAANQALRNEHDSLEVCQTVFVWLWENRESIQIKTNLKTYLRTAIKYKIANLIRREKSHEILLDDILTADIRAEEHIELEVKELQSFINQLINELPEKSKAVFLLSRHQHLSHKQISKQLGISEKTVDDHITRALKKLRSSLNKWPNYIFAALSFIFSSL